RAQREIWPKPISGRLRLNQRSRRIPSSSSLTRNCRTWVSLSGKVRATYLYNRSRAERSARSAIMQHLHLFHRHQADVVERLQRLEECSQLVLLVDDLDHDRKRRGQVEDRRIVDDRRMAEAHRPSEDGRAGDSLVARLADDRLEQRLSPGARALVGIDAHQRRLLRYGHKHSPSSGGGRSRAPRTGKSPRASREAVKQPPSEAGCRPGEIASSVSNDTLSSSLPGYNAQAASAVMGMECSRNRSIELMTPTAFDGGTL